MPYRIWITGPCGKYWLLLMIVLYEENTLETQYVHLKFIFMNYINICVVIHYALLLQGYLVIGLEERMKYLSRFTLFMLYVSTYRIHSLAVYMYMYRYEAMPWMPVMIICMYIMCPFRSRVSLIVLWQSNIWHSGQWLEVGPRIRALAVEEDKDKQICTLLQLNMEEMDEG